LSYWVNILFSESLNSFYKGQTSNLEQRINRHNKGYEKSTKIGRPWRLIWSAEKGSRSEATILEKKVKNMSRNKLLEFINKFDQNIVNQDYGCDP
jgi:putative endonuclease